MKTLLEKIVRECSNEWKSGRVATYIPELGKGRADASGLSVYSLSSGPASAGDTGSPFTMQSVSKVASLALALETLGEEKVFSAVGMAALADPFNSIMRLESDAPHRPHNPLINSGAIAVLSLLPWSDGGEKFEAVRDMAARLMAKPGLEIDEAVYLSEKETGNRNRALAWFLKSVGNLEGDVEEILDVYFRQCSLLTDCTDLALLGATLAAGGRNPVTGEQVTSCGTARIVRTIMATCGMYDGSGEFAVSVGIPAKSGVGGGISAAVPGKMGIGAWGPALDKRGNSAAGLAMLKRLSEELGLRIY
ncbi:MAG: glutaminase A [Aminivibrio sp.]|jgi:glutaminase